MRANGRALSFEKVVRAYSADLFRFAFWLCRDRALAEDLVQETFARAWRSYDGVRDETAVKQWLLKIVRNEHARLYERKRLDTEEQELDDFPAESTTPQDAAEMEQALLALPTSYREALLLQVLGGFSCAEIAAMTGTSEGNVMARLSR